MEYDIQYVDQYQAMMQNTGALAKKELKKGQLQNMWTVSARKKREYNAEIITELLLERTGPVISRLFHWNKKLSD